MTDTEPTVEIVTTPGGTADDPGADHPGSRAAPLRRAGYRLLGRRTGLIAAVFLGGVIGTAAREAIGLAFPSAGGVPYATAVINIGGALVLGLLTGALTGRVRRRHQGLRLLFGTGMCGGFTTYSTLATQTETLVGAGAVGGALGYALGTLLIGAAAAWLGLVIGGAGHDGGGSRRIAR